MDEVIDKSSDKLGTMPIGKLIFQMSVPLMISMFVQATYNLADSIFVARLSENALTSVSLSFPIQIGIIGLAVGTSVGVGSLTSRRFGEKRREDASLVAKTGIVLATLSWLAMAIIVFFVADRFIRGQITDKQIIDYGISYLKICGMLSIGVFQQIMFERLLQSTGRTMLSMICQLSGVIVNIVFDPILIFGYFGFPKLEVAGAAIATVAGQLFGMIVGLILNIVWNKDIDFSFKKFNLKLDIVREIYAIGIASIFIQVIGSVMIFFLNKILLGLNKTAVAVFGSYFKLNGFVFMPVFAMNSALTPIISYNFGAGNPHRIREAIRKGTSICVFIMALGTALFQIFPSVLLMMFDPSDEFLAIGIPALRTISWIFMMVGFSIAMGALFQSVGRPYYSVITTLIRQMFVLLPTAYFMSNAFGLAGVWWSFVISELFAMIMSIMFYKEINKNILSKLEENTEAYGE